jgi:putative ABC transport system permease protein
MAVGARANDILRQFLVEAITLSMLGGVIGIIVGAFSSWMITSLAGWQIRMSPESILLSVGFSAAIGIFFGYYPARKASNLLPIQALRYE